MPDPYEISKGLYDKLAGGAALIAELGGGTAIYEMLAPMGTPLPYVVFNWQGGGDENLTPSRLVNEVWTVKAVAATLAKAKSIAKEADVLLHDQTLTVTGWTNFWCARESAVRYAEPDDSGAAIWNVGAMYRIRLGQ